MIVFLVAQGTNAYNRYAMCPASLLNYLPIAGGRIIGFIPFPKVLVLCEMQSVRSRIWTCVAIRVQSIGWIEQFNHLTVCKQMTVRLNR